ncbi:MAG TPA: hypothetical protein VK525_15005 [Candidatus Saccharimonadales bacterium]|nr:hypothetical protein [Candidatus Saccharimonadales bacterium]
MITAPRVKILLAEVLVVVSLLGALFGLGLASSNVVVKNKPLGLTIFAISVIGLFSCVYRLLAPYRQRSVRGNFLRLCGWLFRSPWWRKFENWRRIGEVILAVVGVVVAVVYFLQLQQMKEQVVSFYNTQQRPFIVVKMPDKIQVEAGKPIQPTLKFFNYGKIPGIVRARVHIEKGEGVIEKFRDSLWPYKSNFLGAPQDDKRFLSILILPDECVPYPFETQPIHLEQKNWTSGPTEV